MTRIVNCALLVLVVLWAVLSAGCGSDESPPAPPPAGTETRASPPSPPLGELADWKPRDADENLLWNPERFCARASLHGSFGVCAAGDRWDVAACVDEPRDGSPPSLRNDQPRGSKAVIGSFTVGEGDQGAPGGGDRCEIVMQTRPITGMTPAPGHRPAPQGETRFFAFDALYDASTQRPSRTKYQTVAQWHNSTKPPGCPGQSPVKVAIAGPAGDKRLEVHALQCVGGTRAPPQVLFSTPLTTDVWHRWVFEIKWSHEPDAGYVRVWYDGRLASDACQPDGRCELATLYSGRGGAVAFNGFKLGNYRAHDIPFPTVARFGNVRIGLTRAAVAGA